MINEAASALEQRLQPGSVHEVSFTDLLDNGQAVGRVHDGRDTTRAVVFVWGPLPGERARIRIATVKAKYAVGEMLELLERSAERVEPFCDVFGACGGCQAQHLSYPAQLTWKQGIVANALRRIGGIEDANVAAPVGMDTPRAYRNKMALVVEPKPEGKTEFGFYQARSHDMVPVRACPIVLPQLNGYIADLWSAAHEPQTRQAFADAKHLISRAGRSSGQAVVTVTTDRRSKALSGAAQALAARLPGAAGLSNSFDPSSPNAVLGRKNEILTGSAEMEEAIEGVRFRVSASSFFQINGEMVGKIFAYMKPYVGSVADIVDLYCGAGTFALFFAKQGVRVIGIEENPRAVIEARANAELNAVTEKASVLAGRSEKMLRTGAGKEALAKAQVVFLDPPRKGSDPATLEALIEAKVPQVWYLSCNPATLARDLAQLIAGGYRLQRVQPFDMFPQTGHIEALAMLELASSIS
jgi:23S rRNA (uracil1939-C5)-methyltransferase